MQNQEFSYLFQSDGGNNQLGDEFGLFCWVNILTGEDLTKQKTILKKHYKEALTQLVYILKKNEIEAKELEKE